MPEARDIGAHSEELPPQCRNWKDFLGGRAAFRATEKQPDTWIPVLDLTPREFILLLLFPFSRIQPEHMRQSLMYASHEQRFCAWPTHLLKGGHVERGPLGQAVRRGAGWLKQQKNKSYYRLPLMVSGVELWLSLLMPVWWAMVRPAQSFTSLVLFFSSLRLSWARGNPLTKSNTRA